MAGANRGRRRWSTPRLPRVSEAVIAMLQNHSDQGLQQTTAAPTRQFAAWLAMLAVSLPRLQVPMGHGAIRLR